MNHVPDSNWSQNINLQITNQLILTPQRLNKLLPTPKAAETTQILVPENTRLLQRDEPAFRFSEFKENTESAGRNVSCSELRVAA